MKSVPSVFTPHRSYSSVSQREKKYQKSVQKSVSNCDKSKRIGIDPTHIKKKNQT